MNVIFEWFRLLFTHRSRVRALEQEKTSRDKTIIALKYEIQCLEQAIRCRDHALASLALPLSPEDNKPVVMREVFRRPTYTEQARRYERQNSARFRAIDAAIADKARETSQ